MILADTSVWVDHLRSPNATLFDRLDEGEILMHPFIVGELMLGGIKGGVLADIRMLPTTPVASPHEVERLIEGTSLSGRGIGYVDAALLAAVRLHGPARLWTLDRRLAQLADESSVGFEPFE